ncbi:MAG: aldehyde dehydrogenase family protein, partial [Acidimicrobiales bacterium]
MHVRDRLYVGGEWVDPATPGSIDVVNATTEEVLGRVPEGAQADVDRAVAAARGAFEAWAATPVEERTACLERVSQGLMARLPEIGALVAQEVGMPVGSATVIQAGLPAVVAGSYVQIARDFPFETSAGASTIVYEPVGVVACLTPWNYPLHLAMCKVAPALAAGCTVVLKPSEVAPLSAFVLAEVADEAGVPPGVFNLVTGYGPQVGEALVVHPDVDMVSFTGSTAAGKRVAELAARNLKRVTLELGGKSAAVVLDDADLEEAVGASVRQALLNSGQTCMAWSRLLVPRDRHDEAAKIAGLVAESMSVGDPLAGADLGPLATSAQRDRVRRAVQEGIDGGALLITGGADAPEGLDRGFYVQPTILAGVDNAMTVAREEIFGPVVVVIPHDGDDDAVRIANDSPYGLHGAVFSADRARAERVARRMRTGQVDVCGAGGTTRVVAPGPGAGSPRARVNRACDRRASMPTTFCSRMLGTRASTTAPLRHSHRPGRRRVRSRSSGWSGAKPWSSSSAPTRPGKVSKAQAAPGPHARTVRPWSEGV